MHIRYSYGNGWRVEIEKRGRGGSVRYKEGGHVVPFEWEFGGGDIVITIWAPDPKTWDTSYPWAAGRRTEIIDRMVQAYIREEAPTCRADIDDAHSAIYLRK